MATKKKNGGVPADRQLKITVQIGDGEIWSFTGTVPQSFLGDSRRLEIGSRYSALGQDDPRGRWTKLGDRSLKKLLPR